MALATFVPGKGWMRDSEVTYSQEAHDLAARENRFVIVNVLHRDVLDLYFRGQYCPRWIQLPMLKGLPWDVKVHDVIYDWERKCFSFRISHPSFAKVEPGQNAPHHTDFTNIEYINFEGEATNKYNVHRSSQESFPPVAEGKSENGKQTREWGQLFVHEICLKMSEASNEKQKWPEPILDPFGCRTSQVRVGKDIILFSHDIPNTLQDHQIQKADGTVLFKDQLEMLQAIENVFQKPVPVTFTAVYEEEPVLQAKGEYQSQEDDYKYNPTPLQQDYQTEKYLAFNEPPCQFSSPYVKCLCGHPSFRVHRKLPNGLESFYCLECGRVQG